MIVAGGQKKGADVFLITLNIDDTTTSGATEVPSVESMDENDEVDEDHAHAADNPLPPCFFLRSIFLPYKTLNAEALRTQSLF